MQKKETFIFEPFVKPEFWRRCVKEDQFLLCVSCLQYAIRLTSESLGRLKNNEYKKKISNQMPSTNTLYYCTN